MSTATVQPIPSGYEGPIAYLVVKDADAALRFYCEVLGAEELFRMHDGDRIAHAELRLAGRVMMIADEYPEQGCLSPKAGAAQSISMMLYVEDVDALAERAIEAGATLSRPVANQFYGDRSGTIVDPFGHQWHLSTHIEDVPPEELEARAAGASG